MSKFKYGIDPLLHTRYRMRREDWIYVLCLLIGSLWAGFIGLVIGCLWAKLL